MDVPSKVTVRLDLCRGGLREPKQKSEGDQISAEEDQTEQKCQILSGNRPGFDKAERI